MKKINKPHIYKITNKLNGKFYYGVHNGSRTKSYKGSGKLTDLAIEKYGWENFNKEVLLVFDTEKEAYEYEGVIVNQKMIDNPMCYNLRLGGNGGNEISIKKLQQWKKDNPEEYSLIQSLNGKKGGKAKYENNPKAFSEMASKGGKATTDKRTKEDYLRINAKAVSSAMANGNHMSQQKRQCIHCGKISTPGNITRWHNDKCKKGGKKDDQKES